MDYKFRGRRIDTGEWVYGHHIEIRTAEGRTGHFIITDDEGKVDHDIPPMGIMFTLNENIFMVIPTRLGSSAVSGTRLRGRYTTVTCLSQRRTRSSAHIL